MGDKSTNDNQMKIVQEEIRDGIKELSALEDKLFSRKAKLHALRGALWDLCDHQWVRDYSCAFDDLCKHYCKVCGLWKDRSLYG